MVRDLFNHLNWSDRVTDISRGVVGRIFGAFGTCVAFAQIRQSRAGARFQW